jgi:site-specific DNA-cytosine methylase
MSKILIACEFSGIVREAFRVKGYDAWSCDLLPSEQPGPHIQAEHNLHLCDIIHNGQWDAMLAFPPCTHLAVSGARWFKDKRDEQLAAIQFVEMLWQAPVSRICIENPIGVLSTRSKLGKPTQIIQPWMFSHGEVKATCLWLKNLPPLEPTNIVSGRQARVHREPPSPERWKNRSRTLAGVAQAMSDQWGRLL